MALQDSVFFSSDFWNGEVDPLLFQCSGVQDAAFYRSD